MQYVITFLEGILSFISPCMLPMLPLYLSYFAGDAGKPHKTFLRAFSFVLGFSLVFVLLGTFAGSVGAFLVRYRVAVQIVTGLLVVVFGLVYLNVIRIPFLRGMGEMRAIRGVFSAFLFGAVYSISLTPCVGAFLGSALMLASSGGNVWRGTLLLLSYSAGLGIPFLLSAVLIDRLGKVFTAIKRHYTVINLICGIFLIVMGILMMTGLFGAFMALIS